MTLKKTDQFGNSLIRLRVERRYELIYKKYRKGGGLTPAEQKELDEITDLLGIAYKLRKKGESRTKGEKANE